MCKVRWRERREGGASAPPFTSPRPALNQAMHRPCREARRTELCVCGGGGAQQRHTGNGGRQRRLGPPPRSSGGGARPKQGGMFK